MCLTRTTPFRIPPKHNVFLISCCSIFNDQGACSSQAYLLYNNQIKKSIAFFNFFHFFLTFYILCFKIELFIAFLCIFTKLFSSFGCEGRIILLKTNINFKDKICSFKVKCFFTFFLLTSIFLSDII